MSTVDCGCDLWVLCVMRVVVCMMLRFSESSTVYFCICRRW